MKRILLILSLFLLVACEPLLSPPPETTRSLTIFNSTQTPTDLPTIAPTTALTETPTDIPQPTRMPLPTNAPIPGPAGEIDPDAFILIPAGSFLMGCDPENNANQPCSTTNQPQHEVRLGEYSIGVYEVTNARYQTCVEAEACSSPRSGGSKTRTDYYNNPAYANYPVVHVSYQDAQNYCAFIGGRLPTEAEWEYAARGPEGNLYPWGDQSPDCSYANSFNNANGTSCVGDTTPIGSYPGGVSYFGLMDMAGNVWEWVADYYSPNYYAESPTDNPTGPETGSEYVVRGGGWSGNWLSLQAASRAYDLSFYSGPDLGFRCVLPSTNPYPIE